MMHTDIIPLILLVGFGTSVFYLAISSIISFRRNLRIAKSSGLPYIVRPIAESSHTYLILQPLIDKFIDAVPQQLDQSGYLDYFRKDWRVKSKYDKHDILGDVFWNVSPGLLALEVADSNVFNEIITSRFRFQKDLALLASICLYGPNLVACDEVNWKRHRRVLGPQFSEDLNEFVWNQATTLALDMFKSWDKSSSPIPKHMLTMRKAGRNREHTDLCTLALRVITGSIFNVMVPFSLDTNQREDPGLDNFTVEAADFSGALEVVTDNLITFMILPRWLLAITGKRGRKLIKSFQEVAEFMSKTINQNKESDHSISRRTTFLTGLTNALASSKSSDKSTELTYDEITGNLFLLGLAGSETTADTMHFAFLLLAMHGDAQDWVLAQIDEAHRELGSEWSYMKAIPKLKFIHLLMLETLRLYPPTPLITRSTQRDFQTVRYKDQQITLPPKTLTVLNFSALHRNPKYWGDSAMEFQPQRWVSESAIEGSFAPFGAGSRACLGRRFSETEFIAVLSTILREYRVELATTERETKEQARARAEEALRKSETYMTLSVGGIVPLKFVKRTPRSL